MSDEEEEVAKPPPAIFVHRVDTYLGRILAQHLGQCSPPDFDSPELPIDLSFFDATQSNQCYRILGSYWYPPRPADAYDLPRPLPKVPVAENLFRSDNNEEFLKALDTADYYVFHLLDDNSENNLFTQTEQAIALAQSRATETKSKKTMILLSSLMTWGKAKIKKKPKKGAEEEPEEEEDKFFSEAGYRKRRPHPSFKAYHELEKVFAKFGRQSRRRVKTTVVGAGIVYGYGENSLQWLFKDAWENAPALKMVGDGKGHVPMIHARDLAQVVQNICEAAPDSRYVIAADGGNHTLLQITSTIGKTLTTGAVLKTTAEDILKSGTASQILIDIFVTDLQFEASTVKEAMKIRWVSEDGFKQSIRKTVRDYRIIRKLLPVKIAVYGPPFTGKTSLAQRLAEFYKLPYLIPKYIVEETARKMEAKVASQPIVPESAADETPPVEAENEDEEEKEEEKPSVTEAKQRLADIAQDRAQNNGDLSHGMVMRMVREKLLSKPCQNQGYVLDNYPATYSDAKELFGPEEAEGEEEEEPESQDEPVEKDEEEDAEVPVVDKRAAPGA